MAPGKVDKTHKGYPLPTGCRVSSLQEFLTDGNASFLRAARAGNVEKIVEHLKGNVDINTSNANGLNALHLASKEGNANVVIELLKRGADVNAATKKGNTALHIASLAGQEEVVRILIQAGANVNSQSQNGFTPLYMAAQENHDCVVSFLLANGANQSLATEDGFTPLAVALQQGHDKVVAVLLENDTKGRVRLPALHIAAKKDDCKAATLLLQSDHNPDVTSKSGFTPLHIAAHYGNEEIAKILLRKEADVNYAAKHQITPLHVASKWGKMNMVALLLENGANIEASTRDGLTPLHCAARSGHDQVVDLLLEKGAPFLAKTKNGLAPLHMASQGDHVDSARILLYHKAPVDDVTVDYLTALHVAAHCGHVKVAKLLLDRKADPNARALNGFTPLHIACKKNRIKVVELLFKHGASIEATTESGLTPLHVASFMGCMNIVIYLIQSGANPDVPTVRGETPLHLAARANQTDIIRILLRNGASVDARAREEQTPLHIAARLGNVDIVSLLLQHGAAVDATTQDLYSALHIAAKEDQEEVAACLLDHGASLTATTKKGFTPLHLAAKYGNIKVARLLLQKEAPVDAQGKNGVTPLHVAAHYDHVNVALLLLDQGASPHAKAKNGYTPLQIAAKKNQMDIASSLLEYGAKTSSESKAGFTPLHLASQEGHADMASLLIENRADVNHKAHNGLTPLHLCAQDDRVNVAHILVAHKAEIDPQTKAGYTPLHVASHFGQVNMVRFLLQKQANVQNTTTHGYTPLHQAAQQGHTLVVNLLLENQASPNVTTTQGQTPLSIAQRLGYISVVETLKVVTETTIITTTTTVTEEKYKVVAPETMQETFMTDSEDEGGADFEEAAIFGKPTHVYLPYLEGQMSEEAMLGDTSYGYLTADEMKSLGDDSLPIDVTKDEKHHDILHSLKQFGAPMVEEDKLSPQRATPVESGFSEKFSPDNIDLVRAPVHAGRFSWVDDFYYYSLPKGMLRSRFLVSFMVDARGGAMRGCRHSGVRIIIPPRKASMPMRITCRYLRKEKLVHPPPLMEGEACASRILEMGPVGARFLGPVIIEVPHFASTRGKEREITILRSDTGEGWREHVLEASEEAVQEVLNESFEGEELSALEDLNTNRITRILTTDFPQYFAIISRVRQEVHGVGPEGGMVSSTVVPQVQAIFPEGALTKKIRVGLQAQPIAPELVAKLLGNRVAVSPIVTVEPRRRKFHKPITLTIPVPQAATKGMINQYSGDAPTLRLLCSITGGSSKAQWEDVTGSTPLTFVNDCVSFTTTVSARFWLMDCRQVNEVTRFATELYQEAVYVPFMSKFVIFAKRHDPYEAQLRVFCMTDDKEDKTLECQEHFTEIAKSRDVEVLEGKLQYLEFAGNIAPVTKSGEQLQFPFQAFHENRLPFAVRVKDPHMEPMGRIAFMREPKAGRGEPPLLPICNLNVALPELVDSSDVIELVTLEKRYDFIQEAGLSKPELIHRADLRLSDIAQGLEKDWLLLAQQLDMSENDIAQMTSDTTCDQSEQALMMLRLWLQKSGSKATGNELEKGLRKINREDIIKNCMFNVELVTDDVEKAVAKVHLDQSGFDVFKEELGSSRDASIRRGASLDISYDEQDIMKEAESAGETSSETGSLFERDQISQALTDDKVSRSANSLKCKADDDVTFPKCKKTEEALIHFNTSESQEVKNEIGAHFTLPEAQTYAKPHEFWPSIPVSADNRLMTKEDDKSNEVGYFSLETQTSCLSNNNSPPIASTPPEQVMTKEDDKSNDVGYFSLETRTSCLSNINSPPEPKSNLSGNGNSESCSLENGSHCGGEETHPKSDGRMRRASKTPPPSPIDETSRVHADNVKEILLMQSALETKFKDSRCKEAAEVAELSGLQATESETSMEQDTSQVSISSLPEDERSEPTEEKDPQALMAVCSLDLRPPTEAESEGVPRKETEQPPKQSLLKEVASTNEQLEEETSIEHAQQIRGKTLLEEDGEWTASIKSVEERSSVPCAFINTAFAGADLIDKVEQGSPARSRSPYEVVRRVEEEESPDLPVRTCPRLQNIPSEISEEDLVETLEMKAEQDSLLATQNNVTSEAGDICCSTPKLLSDTKSITKSDSLVASECQATDDIDSSERIMNGPGEVEYQPDYDWSAEGDSRTPSMADKKGRYSNFADDVIDYEIGEILKSDQQFEDIIERPMTPEPPVDDSGFTNASLKARRAVIELKLSDYELKDDSEDASPVLSPDDSRSGFAYGMRFEKDEAMDIDSDPYSEEKEPMYAYNTRFEREAVLEEEEVHCYGDLYTHEEEDEDALENGDKVKIISKPKKDINYDILAGRKCFTKNLEMDELSVSSLQEFEHLEAEIVSGRKSSVGSLDSLNGKVANSGDDVSLTEFERLERECLEVDPSMQGSIIQLSEIEEGHESQASETSQEHKSDGCKDEELSRIDELVILNVEGESKNKPPFQYVPSDVAKSEFLKGPDKLTQVIKTTDHSSTTFKSCMQHSRDQSNGKSDDIDQDSLRDEISLKPDSLAEDPRHEYLDSLHEGNYDEDDSLQGDIPEVMRDSLLDERHLEDDSLHEMDILPDESSLSMESSFAAAILHDSVRAEEGRQQDGTSDLSKGAEVEIVVSELPKCDIMLSSTDSLEQSSSAAAAFHFESESASLTGALPSEDDTMISSTEHKGRITFRYEDIPVDDLEILVKDGRKVIVDSEGNIQTDYDMKHFLDSEDNLNDFNLCSESLTEIKLPSTSTVQSDSNGTETKFQHATSDERKSSPEMKVEEIHTIDEFGNPKIIKRIKKILTTQTQFSSSSSSGNVEEKLKEFLKEHSAAGLSEEVVQEERSIDDKGNVLLVRTVQQQVLSEPEVHSKTFTGPDAAALSEEYISRFKDLDSTDDVCEYEKMDDEGNIVRVTQQVVIKPEVHSVSFSGPDAREQMEEYMRRFTTVSQNGEPFSTVRTNEQSQGAFPSERATHDPKAGTGQKTSSESVEKTSADPSSS